ncbi:hypothetical protein JCM3774_004160 [Rhodotorula dairenensis]
MSDAGGRSSSGSTHPRPISASKLARNATPAEQQAAALQRLLAKPDREIRIPERKEGVTKTLRAPREMMKNVQGSSAGAGSGEFHVYKQSRRREYERLKIMDEVEEYEKQKQEALERQRAYEREAEERTAKNRLKRQRKKAGRGGAAFKGAGGAGDKGATTTSSAATDEGGGPDKKRKLAPGGGGAGAGFVFKKAEERDLSSDGEDGGADADANGPGDEEHAPQFGLAAAPLGGEGELANGAGQQPEGAAAEEVKPAQEAGIIIQDDD